MIEVIKSINKCMNKFARCNLNVERPSNKLLADAAVASVESGLPT